LPFNGLDQGIDELPVAAHPVGTVEQHAHSRAAGLPAGIEIVLEGYLLRTGGVIQAALRQRCGGLKAIARHEQRVRQEKQQLFDIFDPAVSEVLKGFAHQGCRGCRGRGQLGVDVLFARPRQQGDTL